MIVFFISERLPKLLCRTQIRGQFQLEYKKQAPTFHSTTKCERVSLPSRPNNCINSKTCLPIPGFLWTCFIYDAAYWKLLCSQVFLDEKEIITRGWIRIRQNTRYNLNVLSILCCFFKRKNSYALQGFAVVFYGVLGYLIRLFYIFLYFVLQV